METIEKNQKTQKKQSYPRITGGNHRENQKKPKKPKIFQRWGLGLCTRQVAMSEISLVFLVFLVFLNGFH